MAEELTDEQLKTLHTALEALEAQITEELAQTDQSAATVELDQPIGRLSRVDALQQQKMAEATQRRQELRLQQVRAALRRVEHDEYGYCLGCDDPIGYPRLAARPESPLCLGCQAAREARGR